MLTTNKHVCVAGGAGLVAALTAILSAPGSSHAQSSRGPRDFLDGDQYGNRYRDRVFSQNYVDDRGERTTASRRRSGADADDEATFSEAYPYIPRSRRLDADEAEDEQRETRPAARHRRQVNDGVVRNDYAGVPVHRHYYGGVDRYDSPGYLDDAGRASSLSNGYSRRGVAEASDGYGRGVRTNDVYPLQRDVDPRRYRGRDLNGSISGDGEAGAGPEDIEGFIRSELSVRPGANLRVSSTGTYNFKNYIDQGNQVHARFRLPVHKRWAYGRGP